MSSDEAKSYSLGELVDALGGELIGGRDMRISRISTLDSATPDSISFLSNERYLPQLASTRAGAVIVGERQRNATTLPRIVCINPYACFAKVSALLNPVRMVVPGRHPSANVDASARIDPSVEIGPFAVIEGGVQIGAGSVIGAGVYLGRNVQIGEGTRLYPNVSIYESCTIRARCVLHSGAVIGADGFGIALDEGRWIKVPQIGRVIIGDDVEIGANTTVDRGALDDTIIEDGVKLDNQIQIGHNVRIGAHTAIAACTGIAGSTRIGCYCRIGGAAGIAGHLTIADNVEISAHTLITKSIDAVGVYSGAYPFESNRSWRRNAASLRHLHEMSRRVKVLEKALEDLKRGQS